MYESGDFVSDTEKDREQELLQIVVVERIQELLRQKKWSIPELAAQSQVSVRTVHYIFQNKNITLYTLACLCRGFGIPLESFFDEKFHRFTDEDCE